MTLKTRNAERVKMNPPSCAVLPGLSARRRRGLCAGWLLCFVAAVAWRQAPAEAPIEKRMQEDVSFYLGFDHGLVADQSVGNAAPQYTPKNISFVKGVRGLALQAGENSVGVRYLRAENLTFEKAGSVSIWVKPVKWRYPGDLPAIKQGVREPLNGDFFLTECQGANGGYLGFERYSSHGLTGKDVLMMFILGFSGITGGANSPIVWPDGEWHNVVMTWDPTLFSLYADGAMVAQSSIARKIMDEEVAKRFVVGCPENTAVDEFIIYGRLLSAGEIQSFYEHLKPK